MYNITPIFLLSLTGRYDLNCSLPFCSSCNITLPSWNLTDFVMAGYWPGSPSDPAYIFDQSLLDMWDNLQKRMPGTSESSFINGLGDFSESRGRVKCSIK